jgi:hypothetical protein
MALDREKMDEIAGDSLRNTVGFKPTNQKSATVQLPILKMKELALKTGAALF